MSYRRQFDPTSNDSLAKLARWVTPGSSVLELGAAVGYFTAHLASLGCVVDIVEIDRQAAEEARRHARKTIIADLEEEGWLAELKDARYDAIVCADVLEHLRDGGRLLARLGPLLADRGELLLSVPNVAHSAVIANLVDGRFDYGDEGLLDTTHARFYTWRSLGKLLNECGFAVRAWDATTLDLHDTEFHLRVEAMAPALRELLDRRPHARVYQWLVRAAPGEDASPIAPAATSSAEHVTVRLLHATDASELRLEQALAAQLPIGAGPCELAWTLTEPAAVHRLMLADRTGIVRIRNWRLYADDEVLWSADGVPTDGLCSESSIRIDGETLALIAPDAWIDSGAAPEVTMRANRVTATLEWPAGITAAGDYRMFEALASTLHARREIAHRLRVDLETIRQEAARTANALARAHAELEDVRLAEERARDEGDRRAAQIERLEEAIAGYRTENARLEAALTAQERIIAYRQSVRWWFKLPLLRVRLWWHRISGV
jgi:2-polyprenyl-3-methyl-5-hydroxy-6-metoxy-1,4-benzoquinol methylase